MPSKKNSGAIIAGVAIAGVAGVGAYYLTHQKKTTGVQLATLILTSTTTTTINTGGNVGFTLQAIDNTGKIMPNFSIGIYSGTSKIDTKTTTASGSVSFTETFSSVGPFTITAQQNGVTSGNISVTVSPVPTVASIAITAVTNTVNTGGSVTFNGTAKDQNNNGIVASGTIQENGANLSGGSWTSGANGSFSFSVNFPSVGTFSITATSGSVVSQPQTIAVTQALASIALVSGDITTSINGIVSFLATALSANSIGVQNVPVSLLVNGAQVGSPVNTDASGHASFQVTYQLLGVYNTVATSGAITSNTKTVTCVVPTIDLSPPNNIVGATTTAFVYGLLPSTSFTILVVNVPKSQIVATLRTGTTDSAGSAMNPGGAISIPITSAMLSVAGTAAVNTVQALCPSNNTTPLVTKSFLVSP